MTGNWEAVIGLEIHVQLKTNTKAFCNCRVDFEEEEPNKNICPVCTGQPGTLPVPNKKVVESALKLGKALNCKFNLKTKFDRKNYFYPDLPKGYQISQYDLPLCYDGYLKLPSGKKIGITRIHAEEDTAKIIYVGGDRMVDSQSAIIDFNRAGIPLLEVVSEPDIRTSQEAREYAKFLQQTVRYLGISDADMEKGSFRIDVNVSVRRKGEKKFGTKVELKNLNSLRSLQKAIEYEIKRQIKVLEEGGEIYQETRLWDEKKQETKLMRRKEEAADYRYFPEPDIVYFEIPSEFVDKATKNMPTLPMQIWEKYKNLGIKEKELQFILEDEEIRNFLEKFEKLDSKKIIAVLNNISPLMQKTGKTIKESYLTVEKFDEAWELFKNNKIDKVNFEKLVKDLFNEKIDNVEEWAKQKNMIIEFDEGKVKEEVKQLLDNFKEKVEEYKQGNKKMFGFLMGQVMKQFRGKVPGNIIQKIVQEYLNS